MINQQAPRHYSETPIPAAEKLDRRKIARQPLNECGEPLVPASLIPERILVRPQYYLEGLEGALPEAYLRREVLRRLIRAAELLPTGYKLMILDGWRSPELQRHLFDRFVQELKGADPDAPEEILRERARRFISEPRPDRIPPTPHSTGGAVDLTVVDNCGELLDMGTGFDEMTERSFTRYYEEKAEESETLADSEREALLNRRLLYHVMTEAGFTNFPHEWWHFDYGNPVWACLSDRGEGGAFYGSTEPVFRWR